MTASLEVVTVEPAAGRLRYTFGGGEPLVTVAPGSVVELTTEDCFGGRVRGTGDLPSQVCEFPYLNPVTGPIAVEGAEVGDTLAVHLVEIVPARGDRDQRLSAPKGGAQPVGRQRDGHDP